MQCGSILDAPNGFGVLRKDLDYVFLVSGKERVLLAQLGTPNSKGKINPGAHLIPLLRDDFEEALDAGLLLDTGEIITLPPWLDEISENDLELCDARRPKPKIFHKDRAEGRLLKIAEAISDPRTWMFAEDPERALNHMARTEGCNETRYRTWAITYVACSRNIWALHSPWHNIGRWARKLHQKKFGRPSLRFGTRYGSAEDPELTQKYVAGYEEYAKLGRTLQEVYDLIMVKRLKCKIASHGKQKFKVFIPPAGQGFYTYDQFRYRLIKKFGLEQIQMDLYGEIRVRTKMTPSKGKYAEHLVNLMEEVEADAFSCAELPRGYVMDLCVRHLWIELDGRLYQLDAELKVGGDTDDLYVSLSELEQFAEARAEINSAFRQHRRAASAEGIIRFEEDTGDDWDSIQRKTGRPKKTAQARQEEREAKQHVDAR